MLHQVCTRLNKERITNEIGTSYVGCPTCADDIMIWAKSEQEAQTQLYIIEQCTSDDRVTINSKKTEIIRIYDNKAKK